MRRTRFDDAPCPIARTTDLVGDWWTPLILREAFRGATRFQEFQSALALSRPVLAKRLARLVDEGLLERQRYQSRPTRHAYELTAKGRALFDVLAAMWRFGSDWLFDGAGPALELVDRETGRAIEPAVIDAGTGGPIDPRSLGLRPRR